MKYNYYYLKEYLPLRYKGTKEQEEDRITCRRYMQGVPLKEIVKGIKEKVNQITEDGDDEWIVSFVPNSVDFKKIETYWGDILDYLKNKLDILYDVFKLEDEIFEDEIFNNRIFNLLFFKKAKVKDLICLRYSIGIEQMFEEGLDFPNLYEFKKEQIENERIVLVGAFVNDGKLFNQFADKLIQLGAKEVVGLFLIKTITPESNESNIIDDNLSIAHELGYGRFACEKSQNNKVVTNNDMTFVEEEISEEEDETLDGEYSFRNIDDIDSCDDDTDCYFEEPYYRREETYDNYQGSYVQDVAGWSDQDIEDVLEGDPDAYWNID